MKGPTPDRTVRPVPAPVEGASFVSKVAPKPAGPPRFVLGLGALLTAIIAVGLLGRAPAGPGTGGASGAGAGGRDGAGAAPVRESPRSPGRLIVQKPRVPLESYELPPFLRVISGPLQVAIRRNVVAADVHGELAAEQVTWVSSSLQDQTGRVVGWVSVSVPNTITRREGGGHAMRFDIELEIPADRRSEPLWIQTSAYDVRGELVATTRLGVRADGGPMPGVAGFEGEFPRGGVPVIVVPVTPSPGPAE